MKKKVFFSLSFLFVTLWSANAQEIQNEDTVTTKYRRSSLASILLIHPEKEYAKEIQDVFLKIPVPDKFDDHNLNFRVLQLGKKNITSFLNTSKIPHALVEKWFNYDSNNRTFNMDLVAERGNYECSIVGVIVKPY